MSEELVSILDQPITQLSKKHVINLIKKMQLDIIHATRDEEAKKRDKCGITGDAKSYRYEVSKIDYYLTQSKNRIWKIFKKTSKKNAIYSIILGIAYFFIPSYNSLILIFLNVYFGFFCLICGFMYVNGIFKEKNAVYMQKPDILNQLSEPKNTLLSTKKLNLLCRLWLTKVGVINIEKSIKKLGGLAGKWDNVAEQHKALLKQAQKQDQPNVAEEVNQSAIKLEQMKERLAERVSHLRQVKQTLLSLNTQLDLTEQLQNLQSEVEGLGSDVTKILFDTTRLLGQIRQIADLALSKSFLDEDWEEPEKIIEYIEAKVKMLTDITEPAQ